MGTRPRLRRMAPLTDCARAAIVKSSLRRPLHSPGGRDGRRCANGVRELRLVGRRRRRVWDEELRLARLAADLGFDVLWSVEHHFNDYSFSADNLQLMTHLAAVCPTVGIGTAAVILPWHDPLRVAEQVSVLDYLAAADCVSAWAAASPGASSKRSGVKWMNPANGSTRRPR